MLIVGAIMSLGLGAFVVIFGQERRVKIWFFLLCLSAASLSAGLYLEINHEAWAYTAAKINMTAALLTAALGLVSARVMCGLPLHLPVIVLLAVAGTANVATVWLTDWYFTGGLIRYPWGVYAAGRLEFIFNPLLVVLIAFYGLVVLALHFRDAHPLDKNRTGFMFLAYFFLSLSLFDYVPHFNIDLFGRAVSGVTIPLFLATFGYASLRYRLIEFRAFIGRATGYILVGLLMVGAYFLFREAASRLQLGAMQAEVGSILITLAIYMAIGTRLPRLAEKTLRRSEPDYQQVLEKFSNDLSALWEEPRLQNQVRVVCTEEFRSVTADLFDEGVLTHGRLMPASALSAPVLETEILRRQFSLGNDFFPTTEILIPLRHREGFIGALALGKRSDGKMYTRIALQALRVFGNMFSMSLTNSRSAAELQKRHQLDRYLAPQVVERVLQGDADLINRKQRITVTTFFSDLKGFTEMSDNMNPDDLATVLNEYLSEMAEIAFRFGGTVDKFIGDAVMVFFGAPVSSDTAQNAAQCIRMAIAMQQHMKQLNQSWKSRSLLQSDLVCRIGIHTGEVTVGSFGSESRVDYTAIGSAVNLASRLEGKCTPGKILISADTYRLVTGLFAAEVRPPVEVKGFARMIEVYEIDPDLQKNA